MYDLKRMFDLKLFKLLFPIITLELSVRCKEVLWKEGIFVILFIFIQV